MGLVFFLEFVKGFLFRRFRMVSFRVDRSVWGRGEDVRVGRRYREVRYRWVGRWGYGVR